MSPPPPPRRATQGNGGVFCICGVQVPASVRVRRETAVPKGKPKSSLTSAAMASGPTGPTVVKLEPANSSSAPWKQSIDDSYVAFLEDMKALGALDG
ncbi:hypothetical protein CIPAW_12G005400 [Carya illinoinensis]|uniref:Uncharacterized protein n=1 Tax=Carya illinoinensis TaxID=32201 RepID=A0A8T1NUG4_CARIL|nr:hypothetical protein CIPAW_12G005400 [Carya illinoinensis]